MLQMGDITIRSQIQLVTLQKGHSYSWGDYNKVTALFFTHSLQLQFPVLLAHNLVGAVVEHVTQTLHFQLHDVLVAT